MGIAKIFSPLASQLALGSAPSILDCPLSYETLKKNADIVVRNSEQARSTLHKFADLWCKHAKAKLEPDNAVVMGPTKTNDRIIEKAVARYNGDVFQVSDGCRNRILVDDPSQVRSLKNVIMSPSFIESCKAKGIVITSVEDFFETPNETRWRGLVVKTEIDLGKGRLQKAETVVIPRGWEEEYETTHTYLKQIRALKDLTKAQNRNMTDHEQKIVKDHTSEATKLHDGLAKRDRYDQLEVVKPTRSFPVLAYRRD